jgi:hypothetical protein
VAGMTMAMMVTRRVMIVLPEEYLLLSGLQCSSSKVEHTKCKRRK